MSYHYLLDLALILLSTKVLGMVTRRFQMPQVVGALLAGLILGPAMLDILTETEFLSQLSELGVIVILFTAGMGTDLNELRAAGKPGFLVALCGVLVPLAMGTAFGWLAGKTGWLPGNTLLEDVFLGTILTATSVSITVETLKELGKLDTKVGGTILAAALIDDVLGLIALTVVTSLAGESVSLPVVLLKIVLFFVFAVAVGFAAIRFFRWMIGRACGKNLRRYPVLAFVLCLLMAYCAEEFFGVADITGAFIAGIVLARNPDSKYIERKSDVMSYMIFTPVFFANIGLTITFGGIGKNMVLFGMCFILVGILGKVGGCGGMSLLCGYKGKDALRIGVGMMARAEVALVCAQKGVESGIIDSTIMPFILIMIIITSFVTPITLRATYRHEPPV